MKDVYTNRSTSSNVHIRIPTNQTPGISMSQKPLITGSNSIDYDDINITLALPASSTLSSLRSYSSCFNNSTSNLFHKPSTLMLIRCGKTTITVQGRRHRRGQGAMAPPLLYREKLLKTIFYKQNMMNELQNSKLL